MGLSKAFSRLSERFQRIADSQTSMQVEYTDACASAFGLFERLKAEGDLPQINLTEWLYPLGEEYVSSRIYDPDEIQKKANAWEIQIFLLCRVLPDTCGLPQNVMLFQQPEEQAAVSLSSRYPFRPRAFNFALICEWLADNLEESTHSDSLKQNDKPKREKRGPRKKYDEDDDLKFYEDVIASSLSLREIAGEKGMDYNVADNKRRRGLEVKKKRSE